MAESFLRSGQTANKSNDLKYGSFELHQACERYYKAYMLVYGGTRPKSHKLEVLGPMAKSRSRGFANVFPVNTPEDREAFDNYVGRISKLGTTDYSLSVKNNTNTCWHERKHCAR